MVQAAIDELLACKSRTAIMIAHRLKTIEKADRIAYIALGKVQEIGSHDELMALPHGKYRKLVETQSGNPVNKSLSIRASELERVEDDSTTAKDEEHEKEQKEAAGEAVEENKADKFSLSRIFELASQDTKHLIMGSLGAIISGAILPTWGVLCGNTLNLLYKQVDPCPSGENCEMYYSNIATELQQESYYLGLYWTIVAVVAVIGICLLWVGFGQAQERLNKRVRDKAFEAMVRQEIAWFDSQNMSKYTTQMQEDAARLYMFIGAPLQGFLVAMASVLVGIIISFIFMWPFALLNCFLIPLMGVFSSVKMKKDLGEDQKDGEGSATDSNSPGSILMETLQNMKTISALTLENRRAMDYENALRATVPNEFVSCFKKGLGHGIAFGMEQWVRALQFWFGGWLIYTYSDVFTSSDYMISNFALLASMMGLSGVFNALSDRKEMEESAKRIFQLLDRKTSIDPLSKEGMKLLQ